MLSKMQFRPTLAAALLGVACLAVASPFAAAQAPMATAAQQQAPKLAMSEALAVAKRDFAQFAAHQLQTRGGGVPTDFPLDIDDLQSLKEATVSYGFAVHTIDPLELLAGRSSMQRMAKATNQWRFVISLHDKPIGMATVERNNGRYETVSYGAAVLAKDVDAMAAYHGNADKSNLRLVRLYQARSDVLEVVGTDGHAKFAPLHSARESLMLQHRATKEGKQSDALLEESELLQPLRAAVKQNLEVSR